MITLTTPLETENYWTIVAQTVRGPMDKQGQFSGQFTDWRDDLDYLDEGRGPYGENFVVHRQVHAKVTYFPAFSHAVPAPTEQYPDRVMLTSYKTGSTSLQTYYANHGFGLHNTVTMDKGSTTTTQYLWKYQSVDTFWCWKVSVSNSDPSKIISITKNEYQYAGKAYTNYYAWNSRVYSWDSGFGDNTFPSNVDWTDKQSSAMVESVFAGKVFKAGSWQGAGYNTEYRESKPRTDVVSALKTGIANAVVSKLYPPVWRIVDKDYGELAMEASAKVNANSVNMIAFIRDLRNPRDLVPKLRNLAKLRNLDKLKHLSDNYLTVKYGILPTISDIQSILEAFKKQKPYIDKNGFATYSAGYTDSYLDSNVDVKVEQHLKLAISNEDMGIESMIRRLDSLGAWPTFQNVWDLIPYSFVIDWLFDVGGLLERIDARLRLTQLGIRYVTMSHKTYTSSNLYAGPLNPYFGTVELVRYHRWVSDQCPEPPLSAEITFQDFNHWIEAGALFIQRAKFKR